MDPSSSPPAGKDFQALRASGEAAGPSRSIGTAVGRARDAVALTLVRLGATPNRVTVAGMLLTFGAGYCLARGASQQVPFYVVGDGPVGWWPIWAAVMLFLSGACDMLDGAVARAGRLGSPEGAVLDSTIDRLSDMAIFLGCFVHFALVSPPNLTYQVLALGALCNAVMISYIKARAENLMEDCSVGYWLRPERFVGVLIACGVGHVPFVLWLLAVTGVLTTWRRISFAFFTIRARERGRPLPPRGPSPAWWGRFQLWRHPRGSVAYDLITGTNIALIVFAPWIWPFFADVEADPLRAWLGG